MNALLYIPWFKLKPWEIPLPFDPPFDILPIQPFGVLVALGVLLGAEVSKAYGKRHQISPDVVVDFITHVVGVGFLGAMVLNMVFYRPGELGEVFVSPLRAIEWSSFSVGGAFMGALIGGLFYYSGVEPARRGTRPVLITLSAVVLLAGCAGGNLRQVWPHLTWPGLSSYGGFFGAIFGLVLWRYRRKMPATPVADAICFGLPFGWLFGRSGCFVVHDHPGLPTDFFLAMAPAKDVTEAGETWLVARHDLGFYEVLWSVVAIVVLLVLVRKKRPVGFYTGLVPLMYAPIRFGLDYLRAPPAEGGDVRYLGLTPAQYSSIAILLLGAFLLYRAYTKPPPALPEEARWTPEDEEAATAEAAAPKKPPKRVKKGKGAGKRRRA